MTTRWQRLLQTSVERAPEERWRTRATVYAVLALAAASGLLALISFFRDRLDLLPVYVGGTALALIGLWLVRRGHDRFAAAFVVVGGFVLLCIALVMTGGITAPALTASFPLQLVVVGILAGRRAAIAMGIVSAATVLAFDQAARSGWLSQPSVVLASSEVTILLLLTIAVTMAVVYQVERAIETAQRETVTRSESLREEIERRARAEAALQQAQKMELVGQLAGGVAHDFNNLLTVIGGTLELAEMHPPTAEETGELLRPAADATRRGAELTQRLLAFSRRQALQPHLVDLNELVTRMEALLRRTLGENIDIETVLAEDLHPTFVDPGQTESAILNLAINGRDAMSRGGRLTIETKNAQLDEAYAAREAEVEPGTYVLLSVSDSGGGMDPDTRDRAFEPFFTTKPVGQGSGLGLSMVYGFAKQSGGHAKIYSEPGEGTTVRLYLPRSDGAAVRSAASPLQSQPRGNGESVLLVEDEANVRRISSRLLRSLGYQPREAEDAATALRLLEGEPFDLLFTDLVLPGGTGGADLARRAQQLRPGLRVLYTSGYAENAIVHQGRLDEGVHLLPKPFSLDELAEALAKVLRA